MDSMNGGSGVAIGGAGVDSFAFGAAFNDLSGFSGGGGHLQNNAPNPAPGKSLLLVLRLIVTFHSLDVYILFKIRVTQSIRRY